ncbi:hypothetical protein G3I24_45065, partial [Micromonospora aurantiaca]|nr:hypothetical protein [Micromonospora aurantiaca]
MREETDPGRRRTARLGRRLLNGQGVPVSDLGTPAAGRDGHPGRRRAIGLARAKFMAGERLDMQGLAGELGIDRTTLFRWVGN